MGKIRTRRQPRVNAAAPAIRHDVSRLTDDDLFPFNEGTHHRLYDHLGAHLMTVDDAPGVNFGVWAPNAESVAVIGDFNAWDPGRHPLRPRSHSGIWERFIPGLGQGAIYKYQIASRHHGYRVAKADPFGFHHETPPRMASVVWPMDYQWGNGTWMEQRTRASALDAPWAIYEVHLGSWMRVPEDGHRWPPSSSRARAEG